MVGSITSLPGHFRASSDNVASASMHQTPSRLIEALDLASDNFQLRDLGTPRQIVAAMTVVDSPVSMVLNSCVDEFGETGHAMSAGVERYIVDGTVVEGHEGGLPTQAELMRRDSQDPRESRMHAVLEAGLRLLEPASSPALNLLNVTARTGLVVTLTTVLRQLVGFYVEQALRERDSNEASRAWSVAAITMIGPALSILGAIRDECAGTASVQSRIGRVCMASITMGSLLAAYLTGASSNLLASMVSTNLYTLARDLTNAFFPLQDNAARATALSTGVSTAAYGTVQFALAELNALMPLSGPGRLAAGLGYSLGADAIQGAFNALGAVVDDSIFILCRSWPLLSPSAGLDSALSDPESLQRSVLEVRAGARLPTRAQLANALLNVNASRTSAFQAINLAVAAAAVGLASSDHGEDTQGHILNVCLMTMLMLIYFPFIWSCSQRTDRSWTPAQLSENPAP